MTQASKSFNAIYKPWRVFTAARFLIAVGIVAFIFLLLPWTQNITTKGKLTTLNPNDKPQVVQTNIAGRIEKWFVREGDIVEKGDTLAVISEIKETYIDPALLERMSQQIEATKLSVEAYGDKIIALDEQITALTNTLSLKNEMLQNKIKQSQLKLVSDSMKFKAAETDFTIAQNRFDREQNLYDKNIKSLTDLESKRLKLQENTAKLTAAENDFLIAKNNYINAQIELSNTRNEILAKIAKSKSDKYTVVSSKLDAENKLVQLQNKYDSYKLRAGFYTILAPQSGLISKIYKQGIGETVKEAEEILSIVPNNFELAVEIFVKPMDYPLVHVGEEVRFIFDGWPALVFSGWPNSSFGTFGGIVSAVDQQANEFGLYRILVKPDPRDEEWPSALRVGSGAQGILMLNDVMLGYELWRQLNGFPPDFYDQPELMQDSHSNKSKKSNSDKK